NRNERYRGHSQLTAAQVIGIKRLESLPRIDLLSYEKREPLPDFIEAAVEARWGGASGPGEWLYESLDYYRPSQSLVVRGTSRLHAANSIEGDFFAGEFRPKLTARSADLAIPKEQYLHRHNPDLARLVEIAKSLEGYDGREEESERLMNNGS